MGKWRGGRVKPKAILTSVREAFLASGEFTDRVHNLYGSDQNDTQRTDAFAAHLYQSILGRPLDASAQEWLRNSLDQASAKDLPTTISKAQEWAQTLFNSQEYQQRGRDQEGFVYDLYLTYLGHEPDTQGWDYWKRQVGDQWQNRQAVLNAFAQAGPYGEKAGTLYREIFWLVSDHLGTPRFIAERMGSAAGIKRHDYLPFGEELGQGVGGRAEWHGYQTPATHDTARQQFTGYERDDETGLDFAEARYMSSSQGRFIGADPYYPIGTDAKQYFYPQPQFWNRYSYALNNPLRYIDPDGKHPGIGAVAAAAATLIGQAAARAAIGAAAGAAAGAAIETGFQLIREGEITDPDRIKGAAASGAIFGALTGAAGPIGAALGLGRGTTVLLKVGLAAEGNAFGATVARSIQGQPTTVGDVITDATVGAIAGTLGAAVNGSTAGKYVIANSGTPKNLMFRGVIDRVPVLRQGVSYRNGYARYITYGESIPGAGVRGGVRATGKLVPRGGYAEVLDYQIIIPKTPPDKKRRDE